MEYERCTEEYIAAYPTWKIHGRVYSGYYPPKQLVELVRARGGPHQDTFKDAICI